MTHPVKKFVSIFSSVLVVLVGLRYMVSQQASKLPETSSAGGAEPSVPFRDRPRIKPEGVVPFQLHRLSYPQKELVGIDDRGGFLFLSDPQNGSYEYRRGDLLTSIRSSQPHARVTLRADGTTFEQFERPPSSGLGALTFPYALSESQSITFGDGSFASVHRGSIFTRNKHGQVAAIDASNTPRMSFYSVLREKHEIERKGARTLPGEFIHYTDVIYQSRNPILVECVAPDRSVWLIERIGSGPQGQDILRRVFADKVELIPLPKEYRQVERVVAGKNSIVATFGCQQGPEPYRTFVKTKDGWSELPIPADADFAFVQRVLDDNSILGFITDRKGQKMKEVVWSHGGMASLSDNPAWPSRGQLSLISVSDSRGRFCVRNVTDLKSETSDYYMMSIEVR